MIFIYIFFNKSCGFFPDILPASVRGRLHVRLSGRWRVLIVFLRTFTHTVTGRSSSVIRCLGQPVKQIAERFLQFASQDNVQPFVHIYTVRALYVREGDGQSRCSHREFSRLLCRSHSSFFMKTLLRLNFARTKTDGRVGPGHVRMLMRSDRH